MIHEGEGQLRHQFWGTYSATVAIGFDSEEGATVALRVLGAPWRRGETSRKAIVAASISRAELERQKGLLGKLGADVAAIDSIRKSIDYGERFRVRIDSTWPGFASEGERAAKAGDDSRQLKLF